MQLFEEKWNRKLEDSNRNQSPDKTSSNEGK